MYISILSLGRFLIKIIYVFINIYKNQKWSLNKNPIYKSTVARVVKGLDLSSTGVYAPRRFEPCTVHQIQNTSFVFKKDPITIGSSSFKLKHLKKRKEKGGNGGIESLLDHEFL